jgi:hypothetical protein
MGDISYEEALGSYFPWNFVPHVQEQSIMSKLNVGHSVEVCMYGCQERGINIKNNDESS